jgi:hypothetical protein
MMKYARIVDLKAVNLQRQGKLYTLPVNRGQEACRGRLGDGAAQGRLAGAGLPRNRRVHVARLAG